MHGGDTMICENKFCIYYSDHICTLDSISLDSAGTCTNCIYIDLEEALLETARKQMHKKFENIYKNWK